MTEVCQLCQQFSYLDETLKEYAAINKPQYLLYFSPSAYLIDKISHLIILN